MTPAALLIAQRLHELAGEMRAISDLMADFRHIPAWHQHSMELLGAASMADEWAGWIREQDK